LCRRLPFSPEAAGGRGKEGRRGREGVEFSFSEEQGAERRAHALHARWIDRHQTLSTRFVWSLLLTGLPVSRGSGSLLYLLGSIIIGCALMADE
jgi:hypothetical protein